MYKKVIITTFVFFILIGVGLLGYYFKSQSFGKDEKDDETVIPVSDLEKEQEENNSPFSKYITMEDADDEFMQSHIHWMLHQKVEADDMWGFEVMKDVRIEWLLEALDKADLEYRDVYRDILERWKDEDFTQVDKDHNKVWKLQGGTIGEATKILTISEEQKFLEEMEYKNCYDCKEDDSEE